MTTEPEITIKVLKSVEYPNIAKLYASEHTKVLKSFNVDASSNNPKWKDDPFTYMFIAMCKRKIVAGMRLDVENSNSSIPLVNSLREVSWGLVSYVKNLSPIGLAEVCGWWILKEYSGLNIPGRLLQAGVDFSKQLGIKYVLGFPHQHTKPIMEKYGFTTLDFVGDQGSFVYPDSRYVSTVVGLINK